MDKKYTTPETIEQFLIDLLQRMPAGCAIAGLKVVKKDGTGFQGMVLSAKNSNNNRSFTFINSQDRMCVNIPLDKIEFVEQL